jgi:tetratricopeptide (TPR) repeat protein
VSTVFKKYSGNVRIGELLVQAGMLTQQQLSEAVRHAGGKRLQLGQILVMYGYLSAKDLQAALDAQSMIRDKSIEYDRALKMLKIAYKTGAQLADVVNEQDPPVDSPRIPTGKLGELLLDSGVINGDQFAGAMQRSMITGLPLGRMLVLNNVLSDTLLSEALEVQVRLRDEMMSRDEAIKALRTAAGLTGQPKPPGSITATLPAVRRRGLRLGELLVLGGVLSETDILNALEWGLVNQQPIGQVLINKGLVTPELIDAALYLQLQVEDKTLDVTQASECLARVQTAGCSVSQAIAEVGMERAPLQPVMSYDKFLTLSGVVTDEDIDNAFNVSSKSAQIIARVLLVTGYIDESKLRTTLRCYQMLSRGWLDQDDALASLRYCLRQNNEKREITFDDALKELGWKVSERIKFAGEVPGKSALDELTQMSWSLPEHVARNAEGKSAPDAKSEVAQQAPTLASQIESQTTSFAPEHPFDATMNATTAAGQIQPQPPPRPQPPPPQPGVKRKFTETIAPEDPEARRLAALTKTNMRKGRTESEVQQSFIESFNQLAQSYAEQGNLEEAQRIYERILVLKMNELGPTHPRLAADLINLVGVLCMRGKFNQAEPFMRRVVHIYDSQPEPNEDKLADALNVLARIYYRQEKYTECERPLKRVMELRGRSCTQDDPIYIETLADYARLLRKTNRAAEAEEIYKRVQSIRSSSKNG